MVRPLPTRVPSLQAARLDKRAPCALATFSKVHHGKTRLAKRAYYLGGSGNADLYVSGSTWPTTSTYDRRSINSGNRESVDLAAPAGGKYYYITVPATAPYSGLTVSAELTP